MRSWLLHGPRLGPFSSPPEQPPHRLASMLAGAALLAAYLFICW
jgi:hypothetical protein